MKTGKNNKDCDKHESENLLNIQMSILVEKKKEIFALEFLQKF